MNRIVEHDEELAYVVIEPGVTFRQLHEHLHARSSRLWCSSTDSSPEGSVIGNALDHGLGSTPYGDHFANLCGLEVVLPDGTVAERAARGPGSTTRHTYRWGVGPTVDGLFGQSNYGIVTRAGVWLMPEPEQTLVFTLRGRDDQLPAMVEATRRLSLDETVRSRVKIANASLVVSYFDAVEGRVSPGRRSDEELAGLRDRHGAGDWSMMGAVYGTRAQVRAHRAAVARELRGLGRLDFVRLGSVSRLESLLEWVERPGRAPAVQRGLRWLLRRVLGASPDLLAAQPHNIRLWQGLPSEKNLVLAYPRLGRPAPSQDLDPARDGCGKIWFSPLVPLRGREVSEVLGVAGPLYRSHGFDLGACVYTVNARAAVILMSILYSKTLPGEETRARELYAELREGVRSRGFEQYRLAPQSMPHALVDSPGHLRLARAIKGALDPNGVLAPGKYGV
jgi:4-cresol dehydrogenase (hydroxylating)